MFQFSKYFLAPSLDAAYDELIKNKKNIILGGTSFLRMENNLYNTGIDLMNLSLSYIYEEGEFFHIGAMTTFRQLETNFQLNQFFSGFLGESVKNILGVQFRNNVTVGATVFSRYGFSDLIPALLTLNTTVVLFKGGEIPLEEFLTEKTLRKDILVEVKIRKSESKLSFQTIRKNSADYALLNLALSKDEKGSYKIVLGATPKRGAIAYSASKLLTENQTLSEEVFTLLNEEIIFGDNMRASEKYRRAIARVMLKRAFEEVNR